MPQYCECAKCKQTFAKPKLKKDAQHMEEHVGPRVKLEAGELLRHFGSKANLTQLKSNEIHRIVQFNDKQVTAVCFTYHTEDKAPDAFKAGFRQSELAGPHKYDIYPDAAGSLPIFASRDNWKINGQQVVVIVGCGGYIEFTTGKIGIATGSISAGNYPNGGGPIALPPG